MARIRSIHPGLATDEAFMSMSAFAKAAWPLLWGECDDQGVFEWKPVVMKARLLPADAVDFADLLAEWQQLGTLMRYEINGRAYGAVRNFVRFQRPKSPKDVHPVTAEVRKWLGFKDDGTRPPAGTGRPATDSGSERVPKSYGTGFEIGAQMKEEGVGGRGSNQGSSSSPSEPVPANEASKGDGLGSVTVSPRDPVLNGSIPEWREHYPPHVIADLQVQFEHLVIEDELPALWRWSEDKALKSNERMSKVWKALERKNARLAEAPKMLADKQAPPAVAVSSSLAHSRLAKANPVRRSA